MAAEAIREISPGILSVDTVATFSAAKGSETVKVDFAALGVTRWGASRLSYAFGMGGYSNPFY